MPGLSSYWPAAAGPQSAGNSSHWQYTNHSHLSVVRLPWLGVVQRAPEQAAAPLQLQVLARGTLALAQNEQQVEIGFNASSNMFGQQRGQLSNELWGFAAAGLDARSACNRCINRS